MGIRARTPHEELANALSHGLGCVLALGALPLLLAFAERRNDATHLTGVAVFAATMVLLYLASTVYHALPAGRVKVLCGKIDQAAIFLFIAGSYTPFALGALQGGWTVFAVVWGCALVGVLLKGFGRVRDPLRSALLYLAMGWLVLLVSAPALGRLPAPGIVLLLAGGFAYMVGVVFFLIDTRLRYAHLIWHLFVLAGSTCHFFAALWYSH